MQPSRLISHQFFVLKRFIVGVGSFKKSSLAQGDKGTRGPFHCESPCLVLQRETCGCHVCQEAQPGLCWEVDCCSLPTTLIFPECSGRIVVNPEIQPNVKGCRTCREPFRWSRWKAWKRSHLPLPSQRCWVFRRQFTAGSRVPLSKVVLTVTWSFLAYAVQKVKVKNKNLFAISQCLNAKVFSPPTPQSKSTRNCKKAQLWARWSCLFPRGCFARYLFNKLPSGKAITQPNSHWGINFQAAN